jgi:hypothetical protein
MATDKFMEKYSSLGQGDLFNGSNPFPTLKSAIGDWAAGKRSNTVMGKVDLAALNSGYRGKRREPRQQCCGRPSSSLRDLSTIRIFPLPSALVSMSPKLRRSSRRRQERRSETSPATSARPRLRGLFRRRWLERRGTLRAVPVGAVALPAAGYIAKKIGDLSTKRAVQALDSLVRSRSPLAASVASQISPAIVQALPPASARLLQIALAARIPLGAASLPQTESLVGN